MKRKFKRDEAMGIAYKMKPAQRREAMLFLHYYLHPAQTNTIQGCWEKYKDGFDENGIKPSKLNLIEEMIDRMHWWTSEKEEAWGILNYFIATKRC